jgi:hypothetical protein
VSRALLAAVIGALIATLGPVGGAAGIGRAAAADCSWQRHSKRVVKHVKREGRLRRVVHTKRWWSCDPLPVPPAIGLPPVAAPAPAPEPAPIPGPEPEPLPRRVSVKAEDDKAEAFSFTLSRLFVISGEITIELNNQGQDPHNLNIRPEGSEDPPLEVGEAGPGEHRVARVTLAPGTYRLWCSLPQHEEWGMNVGLEVKDG